MADNFSFTPGSGATGAAELISTVYYPLVKLVDSTATSTTRTGVSGHPLEVTLANGSVPTHAVTVASAGIASGAIASGAVASGAVASGAYASGSISDGAVVTLGAKTDAKSTATDATSTTAMQVLKQISASVQAPPSQAVTISSGTVTTVSTVTAVTAITNALPAGTNKIGDVDVAPRTTGGWSVGNFTSGDSFTALTNTAQVIKGSAGKFGGYYIYNPNSSATYVMVYDVAAASVTVGTTNPKLVFCIPATSGANLEILAGIPFATALSCSAATTGGGASAPATALEAMIWYI